VLHDVTLYLQRSLVRTVMQNALLPWLIQQEFIPLCKSSSQSIIIVSKWFEADKFEAVLIFYFRTVFQSDCADDSQGLVFDRCGGPRGFTCIMLSSLQSCSSRLSHKVNVIYKSTQVLVDLSLSLRCRLGHLWKQLTLRLNLSQHLCRSNFFLVASDRVETRSCSKL
jgi:hypothetical protein